jgi:hypothetical protein
MNDQRAQFEFLQAFLFVLASEIVDAVVKRLGTPGVTYALRKVSNAAL